MANKLKKVLSSLIIITFSLTTLFQNGALAMPVGSGGSNSGNASSQLGQIAESAGAVQSFQADLFTGRAQTSVPIFVPPGRKNVQPSLSLNYSSSGGNGWMGMGWGLDMGFIQRDTKKGVPKYDSTDKFIFSYQGVNSELVLVGTNEYRAKDEALFLKFIYDTTNDKWTVTDKSGTQHTFGDASGNRQTNSLGTFKWALAKVKDTSGNYMSVTYTTDNGELYLSSVEYNGNETQSFAHTHKVEFNLEDRTDTSFSYITGVKVSENKRLNNIQVKVKDGSGVYQLARKYILGYEYSNATSRSRLISVTEYGKDGTTSLPATTFSYQGVTNGMNSMTDYTGVDRVFTGYSDYDYISSTNASNETVVNMADINGDGYLDRVLVDPDSSQTNWKVQLGGACGFASAQNFGPVRQNSIGTSSRMTQYETGQQKHQVSDLIDMNGDGRPDRVLADASGWKIQNNNGSGFDEPVTWGGTIEYASNWGDDSKYIRLRSDFRATVIELIDMNGDGLPDRVIADGNTTTWKVQLNNGSGFNASTNWVVDPDDWGAMGNYIRYMSDTGLTATDIIDLNGDGLPDRVIANSYNTSWKVQWNTGSGFTAAQTFGPIQENASGTWSDYIRINTDFGTTAADLMDLNGDGLLDRVLPETYNTNWKVQWNTGTGFNSISTFGPVEKRDTSAQFDYPRYFTISSPNQMMVDMMDLDGDGMADRVQSVSGNTVWKIQTNKNTGVDLLSTVSNGRGGKTNITYTPSTRFDNTDTTGKPRLPFPINVVTQVDQKDGMGNTYTTTYSYKGGMFDAANREFWGFREVTVTDAIGTKTITTFGQDDHLKGKVLQKEVRDSSNNLFSKEVTTWDDTHPFTGVHFEFVTQVDSYIYDGDSSFKQTRQEFTYDGYGNLLSTIEDGDVSVTGDERKTVNTYVYGMTAPGSGSGTYIVNTLAKTTLYDTDFTTIKSERYFYYDGATAITTAPTAGLLTKEEEWLSTASGCGTAGVCSNNPKTLMTYDSYGNVATVQDARGYTTTNTYETTYHLFLTQISNALSQTRGFTYDPWLAQILTSTDQNSQVTETQYDTLGRVTKVIAPLDSSSEPTQEFVYDYPNLGTCGTTCTTKVTTKVKSSVPGQTFAQLITYSFTDGLGREVERRSPAEDPTKQIVSGIVEYNSRGLVTKQYTSYFENTSSNFVTPVTSGPKAQFTYDSMGRRTRIDYPDSTNSQVAFSDFVKTTTDARGKQLRYTNDAFGRLVKVEEFNGGSTYTTTYEYDVLNNLKKTTDNAGNITTISYDSLSRKTGMVDPDMGTWSYTYDLNDNLASQTDAKSQVISFTYDALNRVTLKDLPSGETDVTYSYDSAPTTYSGQTGYWAGRLAKVIDASGTHEFKYDKQGRVLSDTKTVDSVPYAFDRTYDSMGRVRTLTYPDTEVVTYTYNGFGDIETISGVKSGATTNYIKDVNYNASGQITFTKYGNDVTSNYTYDSNTLRLNNILTKKPDNTTKLQDLTYAFDNNGNVSTIADSVNAMSQNFTYDDLNRLTQATGSAYGTQTFAYDSVGNMLTKGNRALAYGAGAPGPHAVTSVTWSGNNFPTFCRDLASGNCNIDYDTNGNMTTRGADVLTYDSENRLKEMKSYVGADGSQSYTLKPGWNTLSFEYLPDDKSVLNILASLTFNTDYDQVSAWDSASSTWKHWVNDSDFNDFTAFEYGKTYEIYNKSSVDKTFSVSGKSPALDLTHSIKSGDNFISPTVKAAVNVSTVLSSLTLNTDYSDVKRFNAATQTWESYAGGAFTQFEPGKGYNIIGLRNCSFTYGKTETVTDFVYDSTGARVKKIAGSTTTVYLGKDFDVEGTTATKYIFLGDQRVSSKKSDGSFFFYHTDYISSSNVITDASGNQTALYEYDPYGTTVTHTGATEVKHRFTGQEADDSTGLYYYGARYMDPQLGRFITADPTVQHPNDPQDLNRYAYARNNPIRFTDPTGLGWLSKLLAFAAAVIITVATWGAGSIIIAYAAIAGALGGLAGAAIEKSNLMKGAMDGAVIGAAVGAAGATASGGSNAGGLSKAPSFAVKEGKLGYQIHVKDALQTVGVSSKVKGILASALGGIAYAGETNQRTGYTATISAVRSDFRSMDGIKNKETGHSFITVSGGYGESSFGFYPEEGEEPDLLSYFSGKQVDGKIRPSDHIKYAGRAVSITFDITEEQYHLIVNYANGYNQKWSQYNQCTNFTRSAAAAGGIMLPDLKTPDGMADWIEKTQKNKK